ncbi:hypothetical protein EW145_g8362 [Phellinidium pouzarii]|uniref:Fungal-type protein kinase domain-containing protein n=1 Tax=Phellinidium pouzarii TaxID=167371 RepID=A0A4S4K6Q9_9AGAM|nr:hypothetical protein EW145_g8362 [Phellinidium pouzarii]
MFIAMAVSSGRFPKVDEMVSHTRLMHFPKVSNNAKDKYIGAFDEERYDSYINALEDSDQIKSPGETVPFEHLPLHDMESLFWLLAVVLCNAQVPGEKPAITLEYRQFYQTMKAHNPGHPGYDSRQAYVKDDLWGACLHPKLQCVASMLNIMARYYNVPWVYWRKELNDYHAHEMMTRVLLDYIMRIIEKNEDVPLYLKENRINARSAYRQRKFNKGNASTRQSSGNTTGNDVGSFNVSLGKRERVSEEEE